MQEVQVWSLFGELRSHMPWSQINSFVLFLFLFVCLFVFFSRKSLKKKSQGVDAIGLALINHKHLETSKNKTREPIEEWAKDMRRPPALKQNAK